MDDLYAATMDVIQKYGQVQFNLGQMNMLNGSGQPGDVHWQEVRRKARANSEAALLTLDHTVRAMCGLPVEQQEDDLEEPPNRVYPPGHPDRVEDEEPLTHRVRRTRPPYSWEEMEVDDSQYTE